jgi:hypothetical protein
LQVREQAALAASQLASHAAVTLDLTGRLPYMLEILVRALEPVGPSLVMESCCKALSSLVEKVGHHQQEQEPYMTSLLVQATQKLLLLLDHTAAPGQVGRHSFFCLLKRLSDQIA